MVHEKRIAIHSEISVDNLADVLLHNGIVIDVRENPLDPGRIFRPADVQVEANGDIRIVIHTWV